MTVGRWLVDGGEEIDGNTSGSGLEEVLDAARLRESRLGGRGLARALIESEE